MEVKDNVNASKTATPTSNDKQKVARSMKVKTTVKAGRPLVMHMGTCPRV